MTTLGINNSSLNPTRQKDREFFFVRDALSALFAPFIVALWFVRSKRRTLRCAAGLGWIAVGGIAFWCLVIYLPGTTVVHVGSYLAMLLLFAAGGIVATEWLPLFVPIALWQIIDFGANWLSIVPISAAFRSKAGIVGILLIAAVIGIFARIVFPTVFVWFLQWKSRFLEPEFASRLARTFLKRHWRGPSAVVVTCVIVESVVLLMGQRIVFTMPIADIASAAAAPPLPAPQLTLFPVDRLAKLARRFGPQGAAGEVPASTLSLDVVDLAGHANIVAGVTRPQTFTVSGSESVGFGGWAVDPVTHQPAAGVVFAFNGKLIAASYGLIRPDVANALSSPALSYVGFSAAVKATDLARGMNVIRIFIVTSDRRGYYLDTTMIRLAKR